MDQYQDTDVTGKDTPEPEGVNQPVDADTYGTDSDDVSWTSTVVDDTTVEVADLSGDGVVDVALTALPTGEIVVLSDEDLDHGADTLAIDTDGDGAPNVLIREDGDGYLVEVDDDRDGIFEHGEHVDRARLEQTMPEVIDLLDTNFSEIGEPPLVVDGRLVGDPAGDAEHWFAQAQNGLCVPASVAQIVAEYSGQRFDDEAAFVELGNELGVFQVGMDGVPGVTAEGALAMLESSGVPATLYTGGSVEDLAGYLDRGHNVMLFVDSGEYWHGEEVEDSSADHAVVLTGIDTAEGVAILSDPGHPEGSALIVPLDVFEDAWDDSFNTMIVTDQPAPDASVPAASAATASEPVAPEAGAVTLPGSSSTEAGQAFTPTTSGGDGQIERVTSWVVQRPWVLIPVALAARNLASRR